MKTAVFAVAALGVVCAFLTSGAGQAAPETPSGGLTANPVYQKDCAKCHGKTAEGRHFAGPSLLNGKVAAASADDLRNIIANGKSHMPKFTGKLTPEEIGTLVEQMKNAAKPVRP